MNNNKALPHEIIVKILDEIDLKRDETLVQCQLTCTLWYQLITKRLYHSVDLVTQCDKLNFIRVIKAKPTIGEMVNEIKCKDWTRNDFKIYRKYCPNLRSFFCYDGCGYIAQLFTELNNGSWRKMDRIQKPPATETGLDFYIKTVWKIRERLTELFIDEGLLECLTDKKKHTLDEYLASFPKLQSIDFTDRDKHIFEFDKYIDDCPPSLTKVVFTLRVRKGSVSDFRNWPALPQRDEFLSQMKQRPAVKQLNIRSASGSDDSLLYIMRKFPSLSRLELNNIVLETLDWEHAGKSSSQVQTLFLLYLSNIRYLNLDFEMTDARTLLHIPINAICTRFGAKCKLSFSYSKLLGLRHPSRVKLIRGENGDLFVQVSLQKTNDTTELPHLVLLKSASQQLQGLEFDMWDRRFPEEQYRNFDSEVSKVYKGSYISQALAYCPQLRGLGLKRAAILDCGFNSETKQTHLTNLKLYHCCIYPGVFEELSTRLPSLKNLVVDQVRYANKDGTRLNTKDHYTFNMPYTHFQYLRWDIKDFEELEEYYLRLVDNAGVEKYYYGRHTEERNRSISAVASPSYAEGYQSSKDSEKAFTLDIHCASIQKLELHINWTEIQIDCRK